MQSEANEIVALGERAKLAGFPLAGVRLLPAETPAAVREAWSALPDSVAAVIVTQHAAQALGDDATSLDGPMTVVLPT